MNVSKDAQFFGPTRLFLPLLVFLSLSSQLATATADDLGSEQDDDSIETSEVYQPLGSTINDDEYSKHFTLNERVKWEGKSDTFGTPDTLFTSAVETLKSRAVSLLNWVEHNSPVPSPNSRYSRKTHFGGWQTDKAGEECLDVRGQILKRESEIPAKIEYRSSGRCVVVSGRWVDPYSQEVLTNPSEVQIDHLVPLKNAYQMGAWGWSAKKRCWYANFLADPEHLIPVSGFENQVKGDATPHDYMPSNRAFQCQYLRAWLKVKLVWKLAMVPPEVSAVQKAIQQNSCKPAMFQIPESELNETRALVANTSQYCD